MRSIFWLAAALAATSYSAAIAANQSVVTYHNSMERHGAYTIPALTMSAADRVKLDTSFSGAVSGHIYAQPLYWKPAGASVGLVIVATETNFIYALNETTGAKVWEAKLLPSVPLRDLPCGNIDPSGITGTPVIDPATGTIYLDALVMSGGIPTHLIYALSAANGQVLTHWPINVPNQLKIAGVSFSSATQGERSALQFFKGSLYVNYGGNFGDCGAYHGTVIQISPQQEKIVANWQTRAPGGGIWAQGGMASDGSGLFITTGNTMNASSWSDGEAIIRLRAGLAHSFASADYFAPSNWKTLDDEDEDLGGTEAIPLGITASSTVKSRVIAFGKDGYAYLARRGNLGGVGGEIEHEKVSNTRIITAPAVYETPTRTMIAFVNADSTKCSGNSLTMLDIAPDGTKAITNAWCEVLNGSGSPIITTTDGSANPIVWVAGAEGDNELHGFNALTGKVIFSGNGTAMSGLHHFETILATPTHFYVAADNKIYAFTF